MVCAREEHDATVPDAEKVLAQLASRMKVVDPDEIELAAPGEVEQVAIEQDDGHARVRQFGRDPDVVPLTLV